MSGVAVAAALLMSACGGRDLCLEVGRPRRRPGTPAVIIIGTGAAGGHDARGRFRGTATTKPPAAAEEGSEQQPGEENDGPVVVEATPTPEGSNVEGPTGALPEANKETPAEHMPPPAAEPPPLPEAPAGAAATPAAPPRAEPAKEPAKAQSTMGKATKRFHTARLSVADVEGVEQQSIPLNLSMDTGEGTGEVQLRLSGLPETASLSAGRSWRTAPGWSPPRMRRTSSC